MLLGFVGAIVWPCQTTPSRQNDEHKREHKDCQTYIAMNDEHSPTVASTMRMATDRHSGLCCQARQDGELWPLESCDTRPRSARSHEESDADLVARGFRDTRYRARVDDPDLVDQIIGSIIPCGTRMDDSGPSVGHRARWPSSFVDTSELYHLVL
nr:hypothetical protein CFP56_07873 [Quercus suber]